MNKTLAILGALALVATACGGNDTTNEPTGPNATAEFAVETPNGEVLLGNSIKILANRNAVSDTAYPCENEAEECINFDGTAVAGTSFAELCPTANYPQADWTFRYEIYEGAGCTGVILNAENNPYNLVCYDITDLRTRNNPNRSIEPLVRGLNSNEILCMSAQSSKDFAFDMCVDETDGLDLQIGNLVLDCGCGPETSGGACGCGDLGTLPVGCSFEADCDIVCLKDATTLAIARFRSFKEGNIQTELLVGPAGNWNSSAARAQAGFVWTAENDVVFTYDPTALTLTLSATNSAGTNATAIWELDGALDVMNSLRLVVVDNAAGQVDLKNVVVDGMPMADILGNDGVLTASLTTAALNDGFVITGKIVLGTIAQLSSQESTKVEILVGQNL